MYLYLYLKLEILQSILDVQVTGVILDVLLDIQVLQETTQPVIGKASCNTRYKMKYEVTRAHIFTGNWVQAWKYLGSYLLNSKYLSPLLGYILILGLILTHDYENYSCVTLWIEDIDSVALLQFLNLTIKRHVVIRGFRRALVVGVRDVWDGGSVGFCDPDIRHQAGVGGLKAGAEGGIRGDRVILVRVERNRSRPVLGSEAENISYWNI